MTARPRIEKKMQYAKVNETKTKEDRQRDKRREGKEEQTDKAG